MLRIFLKFKENNEKILRECHNQISKQTTCIRNTCIHGVKTKIDKN